jgi:hypothetical protein
MADGGAADVEDIAGDEAVARLKAALGGASRPE